MNRPEVVILDVDGTLVDSNDAHARSWLDVCRERGYARTYDEIRPLIGMGGDKVIPRLAGVDAESEEGERISERRGEIFRTHYLPDLRPTPGARALLERLRAEGLELVVASSAKREDLRGLLKQAGIDDLIEQATSTDDAEQSKPSPDIVQAALQRAGVSPERAVMLGDTPYDIEAAGRAGVRVVAVRSGGWDLPALDGAVAVYDHPADLLTHYEKSPFGDGADG